MKYFFKGREIALFFLFFFSVFSYLQGADECLYNIVRSDLALDDDGKVIIVSRDSDGRQFVIKNIDTRKLYNDYLEMGEETGDEEIRNLISQKLRSIMFFTEKLLKNNLTKDYLVECLYFEYKEFKDGNRFISYMMPYYEQGDLEEYLRKVNQIKESEAKNHFLKILDIIIFLRNEGYFYLDLKAENILRTDKGALILADFEELYSKEQLDKLNKDGRVDQIGTDTSKPPEIWTMPDLPLCVYPEKNFETISVYMLGSLLHHMLVGVTATEELIFRLFSKKEKCQWQWPWPKDDLEQILKYFQDHKVLFESNGEESLADGHQVEFSKELIGLFSKLLAIRPADRFQTLKELKESKELKNWIKTNNTLAQLGFKEI